MAGLFLSRSNRLESLADELAALLAASPLPPLHTEQIVVQSRGMATWLRQRLAAANQVCFDTAFPFPKAHTQTLFKTALGVTIPKSSPFDLERLPWRIAALLPEILLHEDAADLKRYVDEKPHPLKAFQVAQQIASSFDRYLAHRPEKLREWERNTPTDWQSRLWKLLSQQTPEGSPLALLAEFQHRLQTAPNCLSSLPHRFCVFGATALPQSYLELLKIAATQLEIHLFVVSPTDAYWGDLLSAREAAYLAKRSPAAAVHAELAHPLLASWGRTGRAFCDALLDLQPVQETDSFLAPEKDTLLRRLQADLFAATPPVAGDTLPVPIPDRADDSLRVHCCHSPVRELEVLQNQLMHWFNEDPSLQPKDILVTMPDVSAYAPFIEAVFGVTEPSHSIPFTIADRSARDANPTAQAFLSLMNIPGSRLSGHELMDLLEQVPVREAFQIEEAEIPLLKEWIAEAGIRWGLDAEHRSALGLPHDPATTWRAGLERMLLSLATLPEAETLHHDTLASPGPEPASADLLGRLHAFCEALFTLAHPITGEHLTWTHWSTRLLGLSNTLLSGPQKPQEHVELNKKLEGLGALETDFPLPLEWPVVRAHVLSILAQTTQSSRFLAGKATFCALKPLRSIPFRIIAVIGLTQDAFPRRDEVPAFDLRFSEPIKVERSRREEDRELFLETLLSAREKLHLSYSGLSPTNGTESPPSVVVSELLDCIVRDALPAGDQKSRAALESQLVVRHPLQAFSERNFNGADARVFSFSSTNCSAGNASRDKSTPARFLNGKTKGPATPQKRVALSELLAFFRNPARHFLRKTLNIALENIDEALPETDPFQTDNLKESRLRNFACSSRMAGLSLQNAVSMAMARGQLPPGTLATLRLSEAWNATEQLAHALPPILASPLPPLQVLLESEDGWTLEGVLNTRFETGGIVHWRTGGAHGGPWMSLWIEQVALAASGVYCPPARLFFGEGKGKYFQRQLEPPSDPQKALAQLLAIYEAGRMEPLRLFPKTSWAFAEASTEGNDPLGAALKKWEGSDQIPGECEDAAINLCFGEDPEPLNPMWEKLSQEVYTPILASLAPACPL